MIEKVISPKITYLCNHQIYWVPHKGWVKKTLTTSRHDCSTNIDPGTKNDKTRSKMSRALIWDKIHLCRPNMTGDMIKNVKTVIFKKCHILQFCSINENPCFFFFIISLVIFGVQRRTLHQIKALEILFWPYVIIFSPTINICWAIMSRSCIICF